MRPGVSNTPLQGIAYNTHPMNPDQLWNTIRDEAKQFAASEPLLAGYLQRTILDQPSLAEALGSHLAKLLANNFVGEQQLRNVMLAALQEDPAILNAVCKDIVACRERDAACTNYLLPVLYFKGFHALQVYRVAHHLYGRGQQSLAWFFQNLVS
jgi:serine O-acetyltransferase